MSLTRVTPPTTPSAHPQPAAPDPREASLRPFGKPGTGYWLLLGLLLAVVAFGVVAWAVQLRRGLGAAGYNDHAFWAIYIADVVTFIGVSYGGAVISAILRLTGADWRAPLSRIAEGTAVVTVLIGGAFIIPHLGRPDRIWELVTRPNLSSPIFWDFVAVSTYTLGSVIFFVLPLVPDLAILQKDHPGRIGRRSRAYAAVSRGWAGTPRQRSVLRGAVGLTAVMIIPLAVSVHSVLSWAFALVSRPWWHESIWAPYFVVAALYSGVALVILVVAGFRRAYHLESFITERHFVRLGFILATFGATYLYLTFADILPSAYVGEPGPATVFHELLAGHFAPWFWTFVVAGGVLPLLLVALPWTRTTTGMVVAAGLVVPAMWLKRMLMVADPSTYDRITHTFGAYHFTWISVGITLAGVAAIPLLLMLLFRAVPLLAIDEIEELDGHPQSGPSLGGHPNGNGSLSPPARRHGARRWLTRSGAAAVVLLAAGTVFALAASPARADGTGKPPPATVTIIGTEGPSGVRLVATVTDTQRAPLAHLHVRFFRRTTEFGPTGQLVPLGEAATDRTGTATLTDHPAVAGPQTFVAKVAGTPSVGAASARADVRVVHATSKYQPAAAKPLADLGRGLVAVLLATVAAVLLTLLVQVERVRRACRAGV